MGPGRCRQWKSAESLGRSQLNPLSTAQKRHGANLGVAICHLKEAANSDWNQQELREACNVLQNLTIQTYPNNRLKHVLELKPNQHPLDYHHVSYARCL